MKTVYYGTIKKVLKNNFLSLLYSDTDSFYIYYQLLLKEYTQKCYFEEKFKIIEKFKKSTNS